MTCGAPSQYPVKVVDDLVKSNKGTIITGYKRQDACAEI
jgi:hypothetical protein